MSSSKDLHAQATELAQSGDLERALDLLRQLVHIEPDVAEHHNDLGAVLCSLRRLDEAWKSLERAVSLEPENAQTLWNLAEVCLDRGDYVGAQGVLDRLAAHNLLSPDLVNRTATAALDAGDRRAGLELVLRSLDMDSTQPGLSDMATVLNLGRLAVFCENDDRKFLHDILDHLSRRFIVREYAGGGENEIFELLQWSDLAFFEWCGPIMMTASMMPKVTKIVCRLHRYEAFRPWPAKVNWSNVDALITLGNPYVIGALKAKAGDIEGKTRLVTIPNAVNLSAFAFKERERGKNLACLGYLNMRKNPMLLVQCFKDLLARDGGYRLFFAGNFQDEMLEQYMMHLVDQLGLADKVHFDGWCDNVDVWLEDKHFLVTASIGEGHPVGVMEGMARGLKPVLHHFPGAEQYYPTPYLWRTSEEFVRRVVDDPYRPAEYRAFVEERFPLSRQLAAFSDLFADLVAATPAGEARAPAKSASHVWQERLRPFCVGQGLHIGLAGGRITDDATLVEADPDAAKVSCPDGSQDFVYAADALCDARDPAYVIGRWLAALRPGGRLVMSLPHAWSAGEGARAFRPGDVTNAVAVHAEAKTVYLDEGDGKDFGLVIEKSGSYRTGEHVLIECSGGLSQVLCLEPAVRAFGRANPDAQITLRTRFPELFRPHKAIRRSIDIAAGAHDRVSYNGTFRVAYNDQPEQRDLHLVERAGRELGVWPFEDRCPRIQADRFDKVIARKFSLGDGLNVAVAPGARHAFLKWDAESFAALCEVLTDRLSARIIQLGRAGDDFLGFGINLIGRAGPREEAAVLRQCDLAICVDNGYAHMAAAVDVPRVVIFGPSEAATRMHAASAPALAVQADVPCRGCLAWKEPKRLPRFCTKGTHECMRSITMERALSAVARACTIDARPDFAGALGVG